MYLKLHGRDIWVLQYLSKCVINISCKKIILFCSTDDEHFEYLYAPTHIRGTAYLIGMVCGYFVFKTKANKSLNLSKVITTYEKN